MVDEVAREESSLTLSERLQEFFENLSVKWSEFVDWADEKGIPLRGVNDFFESKGIPALPAILFILLAIGIAGYFVFLSVSQPAVKNYTVTVLDSDGLKVANASVQLRFLTAEGPQSVYRATDAEGIALFEKIPASTASISVSASDFEPASSRVSITEGDSAQKTVQLLRAAVQAIQLTAIVAGPSSADISLFYSNGSLLAEQNAALTAQFDVEPNQNYSLEVSASGYRVERKEFFIGSASLQIPIRLYRDGEERTGLIYARVFEETGTTPVANASISLRDESTGAELGSAISGEDGASQGIEVVVGRSVVPFASADGFISRALPPLVVGEESQNVLFKLVARTAENSKNIVVTVTDTEGNDLDFPNIEIYCAAKLRERSSPHNGVAAFDIPQGETCIVAASRDGFLPVQRTVTSRAEVTIQLQQATSSNSGALKVTALDSKSNPVAAVDIVLYGGGKPLGIRPKATEIDGGVEFEAVPLGLIEAIASSGEFNGRGSIEVKNSSYLNGEPNQLTITLTPAAGIVEFQFIDHFTRQPVTNAKVEVTATNANAGTSGFSTAPASCTASAGTSSCFLSVASGRATAHVTADGYAPLTTVEFDVLPGTNTTQVIELIGQSVANNAELVFLGVFNAKGKRVSVLEPSTQYFAKYILKSPGVNFASVKAFVQVGASDVDLESGAAKIISYSAPGARILAGVDFSLADAFQLTGGTGEEVSLPTQVLSTGDLTALPSTSGTSASLASRDYKWVEFSFDSFEGSKELQVTFLTAAVESGEVQLLHRTVYEVIRSDGVREALRSPQDSEAGKSNSPLLAALSPANVLQIEFEGQCIESMCVQAWFEGSTGRKTAFSSFEVLVPEVFKLHVRSLTPPQPLAGSENNVNIALSSQSDATESPVQILEVNTGDEVARPQAGRAAIDISNGGEAVFSLRAVRFSNDAALDLVASGGGTFEKALHLSVSNARNQLRVSFTPSQLKAFEETTLKVKVEDAFGTSVSNAQVVLNAGDSLTTAVTAEHQGNGIYAADVTPASFGSISYSVNAEGFRRKTGEISVTANRVVSIEPATGLVAVSADSTEVARGSEFTITNLLQNKPVRVSLSVVPDSAPKYTAISLDSSSFTLAGGQSKTVALTARISSNVLLISNAPSTLRENFNGRINLRAKAGTFTQSTSLPFTARTTVNQESLSQLVDISADSLEFSVDLPRKRSDAKSFKVTNKAKYPILINQQSSLPGVRVTPLSAVIPPEGAVEFNVTARPSPFFLQDQCVFEDANEQGDLQLIASFQGIRHAKNVPIEIQVTSHSRCFVPGALATMFPVDFNFLFPPGTVASRTPALDNSQAVKLPDGTLVVFTGGAQVTNEHAYLPAGVAVELPPGLVNARRDGFEVRLPFDAMIGIPPDATQTSDGGNTRYSLPTADVILPSNLGPAFLQGGTNIGLRGFRNIDEYSRFGAFFGTRTSYQVPAFTPINIVIHSRAAGEPFEITYGEAVFVDAVNGQVRENGQQVEVNFDQCTQAQVRSSTPSRQQLRDVLPAARRITFTNADVNGRSIRVHPDSVIRVTPCVEPEIHPEQALFQTRLLAPTTFVLSPGAPDPRRSAGEAAFPSCAELVYHSAYSLGVDSVRKIVFPQTMKVTEVEGGAKEIKVEAGETVSFLPCHSISPGVSSFTGYGFEVRTATNQPAVFEFNENDIRATEGKKVEICLDNRRQTQLVPAASNYITGVTGIHVSGAITEQSLSVPASRSATASPTSPLSVTRGDECNNKFVLTATMPSDVHDGVCVTTPGEFSGNVIFKAKETNGNWVSPSVSLPVTLKVNHDERSCQRDQERRAATMLQGFTVDYSTDNINERTGTEFVFAFKGTGSNHVRFLSLANNAERDLTLSASGSDAVNCEFPSTIASGDAIAVKCTPRRATPEREMLAIRATSAGDNPINIVRTVKVEVFNGDDAKLYSSSPWGEVAPQPPASRREELVSSGRLNFQTRADEAAGAVSSIEQAGGYASQCFKHYCTYSQARRSFDDFVNQMRRIADEKTASKEAQRAFCQSGQAANYKKSTILHLTNTERDLVPYLSSPQQSTAPYAYSVSGTRPIRGCGIYKITARLDLCSRTNNGDASDEIRRSASQIQIIETKQLAECDRTIANAPLFLAGREEDLEVISGRELGAGLQQAKALGVLGTIAFGPYQTDASESDTVTKNALLRTIYGENPPAVADKPAENYDQNIFCAKRGAEQIGIITGGGAVIGTSALFIPGGQAIATRFLYGVGQAAIACGLSGVAEGAVTLGSEAAGRDRAFVCPTINACIRSSVIGAVSTALPGAGTAAELRGIEGATRLGTAWQAATTGVTTRGLIGYGAVMTAATAGAEIYNAQSEESEDSPTIPPGLAGPTAYSAARAVAAARGSSTGLPFTSSELDKSFVLAAATTIPDTAESRKLYAELARQNVQNPGRAVELALDPASSLYNRPGADAIRGLTPVQRYGLQTYLNILTKDKTAMQASAIRAALLDVNSRAGYPNGIQLAFAADYDSVYDEVLRLRGQNLPDDAIVARVRQLLSQRAQALGISADGVEKALAEVTPEMSTRLKAVETPGLVARSVGRARGFASRVFPAVTQVLAQLAIDVDVRPVEARIDANKKNAIIVYHIEDPWTAPTLPTVHRVCVQDANGNCRETFYLADACNSDTDACLYSYALPGRTSQQSYSLLVSVNNPKISPEQLFNSVMLPNTPPVSLASGVSISTGELTADKISRLRSQETDTGNEKALGGRKVISTTGGRRNG